MSTTISQPTVPQPYPSGAYAIWTRETWSDEWKLDPILQLVTAKRTVGSQDLDAAQFRRPYGEVRNQYATGHSTIRPRNLRGHWVRVAIGDLDIERDGDTGDNFVGTDWIGRIENGSRQVLGYDSLSKFPIGIESWNAYGPAQSLRKIDVSTAWWWDDAQEKLVKIEWTPGLNVRDGSTLLIGNRDTTKRDADGLPDPAAVYNFAGKPTADTWTHRDFIDYLIYHFTVSTVGPIWRLAGELDMLDNFKNAIPSGDSRTLADWLARLLSPRLGIGYTIEPWGESAAASGGFEIRVFPLSDTPIDFGGVTLPANKNQVNMKPEADPRIVSVQVEDSGTQQYAEIEVIGARILVCCSLYGSGVVGYGGVPEKVPTLTPMWPIAAENLYKAGTGTPADTETEHDLARRADALRLVYTGFAAPATWDHNDDLASPAIDWLGALRIKSEVEGKEDDHRAPRQGEVRSTLGWLPLREGVDYANDPPVDPNTSGREVPFMRPQVWIGHPENADQWVQAADAGFRVAALRTQWGVMVAGNPAHLLALGDFGGAAETATQPVHDHTEMVATIAFRTDARLALRWLNPNAASLDSPTKKTIRADDAELWVLTPGTVYGVGTSINPDDNDDVRQASLLESPAEPVVLRNDAARLYQAMAGALARYRDPRQAATVTMNGLHGVGGQIGSVVKVIQTGGDQQNIRTPITLVRWDIPDARGQTGPPKPVTTIQTGFVR